MVTSTLKSFLGSWFDVLDDWLRDRFVFIGWSGLYFTLCLSINRRLVRWNYFFRYKLVYTRYCIFTYLEGQTFNTVSTGDAIGHSLMFLWGPEHKVHLFVGVAQEVSLELRSTTRCIWSNRLYASSV